DPEELEKDFNRIEVQGEVKAGDKVIVSTYRLGDIDYYRIRLAGEDEQPAYNLEGGPRFLFFGASIMTLAILALLCRQFPDFFLRSILWLRSRGRYHLKVIGMHNLPSDGPVILATNCDRLESSMQVVTATDRTTSFVVLQQDGMEETSGMLKYLAKRTGFVTL